MTPLRRLGFLGRVVLGERAAAPRPRLLTYIVTFACNARCVMCDSWRTPRQDELTLEDLDRIFGAMPALDAVRLSGGEPFVRQDLAEIAALAERRLRPLLLVVSTNAFLTERVVKFCETRGRDVPLHLVVSLDGVDEEHDRIRGRDHSFSRAWETIAALAPRRRELGIRISVNQTVIDDRGVEQYALLTERLRPLGVPNDVVVAYAASSTYTRPAPLVTAPTRPGEFRTFGTLTPEAVRRLAALVRENVRERRADERFAKLYYLEGVTRRLLEGVGEPNPRCVALGAHLRLFPNGDVPVCQFNGTVIGNLRERPFADVWNGAAASEQRDWVAGCAGCWAECEVLPSAIYTGDLVRRSLGRARAAPAPSQAAREAGGR